MEYVDNEITLTSVKHVKTIIMVEPSHAKLKLYIDILF